MSLKIDDSNYEEYKKVLEIMRRHLTKDFKHLLSADSDPITVLTSWESTLPKSKLRQGLKQAITDMLTDINDYPKLVVEIDSELTSNNLPRITQCRV